MNINDFCVMLLYLHSHCFLDTPRSARLYDISRGFVSNERRQDQHA